MNQAIETLKQYPVWTGCKYPDKTPLNPHTGGNAQSNNPATFGSYEQAVAAKTRYGWTHIGVAFVPDVAGVMGIDIDKCADENGAIEPWALEIIRRIDSYAEYSPSGRGVHVLCYGALPKNIGANDAPETCEMYDRTRWFTVTGNHIQGTPESIEPRYRQVLELHVEMLQRIEAHKRPKPQPVQAQPATGDRAERYGQTALAGELATLAATAEGSRNEQLFKSAAALRELSNSGVLDWNAAEAALSDTARAIGLDDREVEKTLESAKRRVNGHVRGKMPDFTESAERQPGEAVADAGESAAVSTATGSDESYLLWETIDDEGNAQCLLQRYPNRFVYVEALGWMVWTGKYWRTNNAEAELDRAIVETLKARRKAAVDADKETIVKSSKARPNSANIRSCKYNLQSLVNANVNSFDTDPDLLNCKNGVVNLRTGDLIPHDPAQRFTYCVRVNYDPLADSTEWVRWLESAITPEGASHNQDHIDLVNWLQRAVGYSLTGHTLEQCLFYLQGPTRAGKGILLQTLLRLVGKPLGKNVDFDTFVSRRKADNQNFDLAPLRPSRLVTASESERGNMLNAKRIKAITGNDDIYCAHKGKDFFSYTPLFKIWLASNFDVMGDADDDALWGRLRVIHFPNSYLGREDFNLAARLQSEKGLEGVLSWAVAGAKLWYAGIEKNRGLGRPKLVEQETDRHKGENDTVGQWLEDSARLKPNDPDVFTPIAEVRNSYVNWCQENDRRSLGGRKFNHALERRGCHRDPKWIHGSNKKVWYGVGLLADS